MIDFLCRISDARRKNPVKVIGLTALVSGLLMIPYLVAIEVADLIVWPGSGIREMVGIFILVLSVAGILGLFVTFLMLLGQLMSIINETTSENETMPTSQSETYSGRSQAHGELDEYEKGALECQMYHDSFMIAHDQDPLDYGDWVDHVTDPFGFGDD